MNAVSVTIKELIDRIDTELAEEDPYKYLFYDIRFRPDGAFLSITNGRGKKMGEIETPHRKELCSNIGGSKGLNFASNDAPFIEEIKSLLLDTFYQDDNVQIYHWTDVEMHDRFTGNVSFVVALEFVSIGKLRNRSSLITHWVMNLWQED